MQKPTLLNIFKVFVKIGLILLGGGYVIIPIMQNEIVEKRGWIDKDELLDYYCVSQCLPGIIAINMSILVGCKLARTKGAVVSVLAMSFTPFVSIVIIATFMQKIMHLKYIEGLFWGINLCVIVLIYLALKEMWKKTMVDIFAVAWFILVLVLSILKISPAILIIASILFAVTLEAFKRRKDA